MKRFLKQNERHGFTLVELLVVIGIIALLISILLPTLSRARDSANTVKCSSNLRQIGIGIQFYVNDNQLYIVPVEQLDVPLDSGTDTINLHWAATLVQTGAMLTDTASGGASGAANDLTDIENIFRCPEGADQNRETLGNPEPDSHESGLGDLYWLRSTTDGRQVPTWYGANGSRGRTNADFRGMWPMGHERFRIPGADPNLGVVEMHKITRVPEPTKMALIFDGVLYHDRNARRITTRHRDRTVCNVLLADGHVVGFSDPQGNETTPDGDLPEQSEFALDRADFLTLNYPRLYWNLQQRD
ncbi:MAG: prepilin-type N-terminal cleavage/methylation domain-containing protein [Planctomycetota bacterium]